MTLKDTLLALVIILVWGVNFVVIAVGLEGVPPLLMGGFRFLLVAVLGCWFVAWPKMPLYWILGYALTLSFAQFAFLFLAMSVGMPAGLASLILQSQALFTLLFAFLILKEQISITQVSAIVIAGLGLAVIGASNDDSQMTILGFGLTLVAASCWAVGNLMTRTIAQKGYKADVSLVIWSAFIACVPFFVSSYYVEGPTKIVNAIVNIAWQSVAALLYLAIVATMIGYSLWSYLLSKYPAGQVAPLTLGVPVVGLISADIFLEQSISFTQLIGVIIVMFGLIINLRLDKMFKKSLKL